MAALLSHTLSAPNPISDLPLQHSSFIRYCCTQWHWHWFKRHHWNGHGWDRN